MNIFDRLICWVVGHERPWKNKWFPPEEYDICVRCRKHFPPE